MKDRLKRRDPSRQRLLKRRRVEHGGNRCFMCCNPRRVENRDRFADQRRCQEFLYIELEWRHE